MSSTPESNSPTVNEVQLKQAIINRQNIMSSTPETNSPTVNGVM